MDSGKISHWLGTSWQECRYKNWPVFTILFKDGIAEFVNGLFVGWREKEGF